MKKLFAFLLVLVLVFAATPTFAEETHPEATLSVIDMEVLPDTDTVNVYFNYETTAHLVDGTFIVTFPADKLALQISGTPNPYNPAGDYIFLPSPYFNATQAAEGTFVFVFAALGDALVPGVGQIAKLPFTILDPEAEGEYEITIQARRLTKWIDGVPAGQNLVSDATPIEATGTIKVDPTAAAQGNVDGDETITSTDARLVLQYAAGKIDMTALNMHTADVDGDGDITSTDARLILQHTAGKISGFPK